MVWNIPWIKWGQLFCLGPFPASRSFLSLLTGATAQETEMALVLCEYCSATAKTLVCYQQGLDHKFKT